MTARRILAIAIFLLLCGAALAALGYARGQTGLPDSVSLRPPDLGPPRVVTITRIVRDDFTDQPIAGADVAVGDDARTTDAEGRFSLTQADNGVALRISAPGYESTSTQFDMDGGPDYRLRPNVVRGRVVDDRDGRPLADASVFLGKTALVTDGMGAFTYTPVAPGARLMVMLSGYAKADVEIGRRVDVEVRLKPLVLKGAYLSFYAAGWVERREKLLSLIDRTELNAVVIDVKGDMARVLYPSEVPLAKEIGASENVVDRIDPLLADLKKRGIYTIARIVVFKDDLLAKSRPELAVKMNTGGPFIDWENLQWTDPFRKDVWEYNVQLAEEAARHGFDEVQFDYVRFPTDGDVGNVVFSQPSTPASRQAAIEGFLALARSRLHPLGAFVSADTFGWTLFREDEMGIGQHLEDVARQVDYLSPMVYPSTWGPGSRGIDYPPSAPGEIVDASVRSGVTRLNAIPTVKLRPWLQDFDDYGPKKVKYYKAQVRAQIDASEAAGSDGWLLWDPTAIYTDTALKPQ